ncbi:hypothetical protein [Arabidopsis thaliana]|uniref:Uncharacterized protein AT4g03670 n=1 Tax=Arabidopsis thaliana TaxID=3702 RepID=Q9SY45_ARATH|nr:hypothetical protein [Arabidopsis thaliana]CAB77852.1 hypothetical protein [Arabidopsis thaliana]
MILCDEIGTMIDAIAPSYVFEHDIPRVLEEGSWFFMEDIHVIKASVGSPPFTDHKFKIKFLEYTKLSHVDAYGVVVRVENITRPDYVPQDSKNPRLSQFLEFELKNTWGQSLTCVATGYTCDLFVRLWRELGLDLGYEWTFGMNTTTCVLRFWKVADHEGLNFLNECNQLS